MFNLDNITKNKDWPFRKLIIGPSGSGKSNYLLNSIQKDSSDIWCLLAHLRPGFCKF